jgi:L-threonylcarbamoyladenylate synthase
VRLKRLFFALLCEAFACFAVYDFVCLMIQKDNVQTQAQAAKIISEGGVIAFRTDTFYGLGADPFNESAVRRIRRLKGREEAKPILLLISDSDRVDRFINNHSELFTQVANRFWPGPLTLVSKARTELSRDLTAGTNTIGVRLPDDENVRALVRLCGGALTATSANASGQPPARTAMDVENYFRQGIDLIIDGGEATVTQPSTVLDLSGAQPRLIREGAITREELKEFGVR